MTSIAQLFLSQQPSRMQATVDRPEGKFYVGYLSRSMFHNNLKRFGDVRYKKRKLQRG
jgi:hypothetical protein